MLSNTTPPVDYPEDHGKMEKTREIWGISVSMFLINLAAIMEKADETLLPAVYREVGQDFGASPSQLGYLTFIRAFIQALSSPLAGILALRYPRPSVVGFGTLLWALSTAGVALAQTFTECAIWRAVNGVGLAIVIPPLQSFIADSHSEGGRGLAFGWLSLIGSVGGISGSMLATIMAGHSFAGYAGWRVAHMLVAVVSTFLGLLVYLFVIDPKEALARATGVRKLLEGKEDTTQMSISVASMWKDSLIVIKTVLKIRSFQIIVLQGIVGSIPWSSMVFFTMWFELIGFGHEEAATLMGVFAAGCAFGSLLGGWIADRATQKQRYSGRIMCAQFSSFMGIPFSCLLLVALPQNPERGMLFGITLACMGLTISWCQACANSPIFADIVHTNHRTMIYAFDRAFEGSFAALAAPMVGLLAENVYGYRVGKQVPESGSPVEAVALSRGLLTMMAIPFGLCCLFYTPLYVTYKRDHEVVNNYRHFSDEELDSKRALE